MGFGGGGFQALPTVSPEDEVEPFRALLGDVPQAGEDTQDIILSVDGAVVDEQLDSRTLGLSLDELREKDERIAVAHGTAKVCATLAALRAGVVSTLVIDEELAQALVEVA